MDYATGAEEQQRLKEGVGHEVEDPGRHGPHPDGQHHVPQLAHRGEREHALDVHGRQPHRGGKDRGECTDRGHDRERRRCVLKEREGTRHEIDAGGNHRRGVDERTHRRRALHRVWQPDVQRELRGLADRAKEDEEHRHRQRLLVQTTGAGELGERCELERPRMPVEEQESHQ